jgi:hypothetical protein
MDSYLVPLAAAMETYKRLAERLLGLQERGRRRFKRDAPTQTLKALDQFIAIAMSLNTSETTAAAITREDITRLGDYGLNLLGDLDRWLRNSDQQELRSDVRRIVLAVADWIVRQKGRIETLEPIVDACAFTSNTTKDGGELGELSCLMGAVITACTDAIKSDPEKSNPGRPWRLLHWNRGIAATRSHRLDLMEKAFAQLLKNLPQDAEAFFREGMQEMERLDYPSEVRVFMQRYFDRYTRPRMN